MAIIKAFSAYRPVAEKVAQVASRPYDVLSSEEARVEAEGNPYSFLRVVKPEIDLPPETDHYSPIVYETGRKNFEEMIAQGLFTKDKQASLYLYQLEMGAVIQTGIVALASIEDYFNDIIKKHELTRPDKERDRKTHVKVSGLHAEPVFFSYPAVEELDQITANVLASQAPTYDFTLEDGVKHRLWTIQDPQQIDRIIELFEEKVPYTYVADGHHRTAAAALVGQDKKVNNPDHTGEEPYNYFLAVHFPDNQLQIIDYNRLIKDLNGMSEEELLTRIQANFELKNVGTTAFKPDRPKQFGMYLSGSWYALNFKKVDELGDNPIEQLDVSVLSSYILEPLFNITDLRRDERIDFVGGIRGLDELSKRVDSGEMKVAFALYPVSMTELMNIADQGEIMPPKSTWFEPKLRSGLFVNAIE